jgi:hypothetical protein
MNELATRILQFEAAHTTHRPTAAEIRAEFGITKTRYTQLLYNLIDTPEALEHDPLLVHRLRRIRENTSRNT